MNDKIEVQMLARNGTQWKTLFSFGVPVGATENERKKALLLVIDQQYAIDPYRGLRGLDKDGSVLVEKESKLDEQRKRLAEMRQTIKMNK